MTNTVTFGWPPKELSPNARPHRMAKWRASKKYKLACWVLAKEAKLKIDWDGPIHVQMEFIRPTLHEHDKDNLVSSMKYGLDGLALALGVNDSRFVPFPTIGDGVGGMVKVTVTKP